VFAPPSMRQFAQRENFEIEVQLRYTWTRGISLRGHKNLAFIGENGQGDDLRTFLDAFVASSRENHSGPASYAGISSIEL
jgi:hypothetical protein